MKKIIAILMTGMILFAPVAFAADENSNGNTQQQMNHKSKKNTCNCNCSKCGKSNGTGQKSQTE